MKKTNWDNLVKDTCLPAPVDIQQLIVEMLSQPLAPGNASRCICTHCGLYGDIEMEYANKLLKIRKLLGQQDEVEVELKKVYFTTSYCEVCISEQNLGKGLSVELKII